jgi:membrane glycosyltransferase
MTPQQRRERQLEAIREAARQRARQSPPLTERQIERLVFLIDPLAAARPHTSIAAPLPAAA